jgi:hypothetical protein
VHLANQIINISLLSCHVKDILHVMFIYVVIVLTKNEVFCFGLEKLLNKECY